PQQTARQGRGTRVKIVYFGSTASPVIFTDPESPAVLADPSRPAGCPPPTQTLRVPGAILLAPFSSTKLKLRFGIATSTFWVSPGSRCTRRNPASARNGAPFSPGCVR